MYDQVLKLKIIQFDVWSSVQTYRYIAMHDRLLQVQKATGIRLQIEVEGEEEKNLDGSRF